MQTFIATARAFLASCLPLYCHCHSHNAILELTDPMQYTMTNPISDPMAKPTAIPMTYNPINNPMT